MPTGVYVRTKPMSKATKAKVIAGLTGRPVSLETRRKISEANKGKHGWTKEQKRQIGLKQLGHKASLETRQKMSLAHKGVVISKEHRERLRILHLGENNPQWRGGVTPVHQVIRHSKEYKAWRLAVWQRDRFTCVVCGAKRKIEADHIKPFARHPELRFDVNNGQTLCRPCHTKTESYGRNLPKCQ